MFEMHRAVRSTEPLHYPFQRPSALQPPPQFARLRTQDPVVPIVLPSGDGAWLVTRYDDIREILVDHARFSRVPGAHAARIARTKHLLEDRLATLFVADPPAHARLRRLVQAAFTPRRIEGLRGSTVEVADGLLRTMAEHGPPADISEALAFPLSIHVICELLGVPVRESNKFRRWVEVVFSITRFDAEQVTAAFDQLEAYIEDLIRTKRHQPADDLPSALIAVRDQDAGWLSEQELLSTMVAILIAGYETTANQIAKGVVLLLDHPDQLAAVRERRELIPGAVEEVLRYAGLSSFGLIRYTTAEVRLGGRLIPAGATLVIPPLSANYDEARFDRPEVFDAGREDNQHLAFGAGAHYCLGAALARMELQVAFELLLDRFPTLRLAVPRDEIRVRPGLSVEALEAVPVAW